MTEPEGSVSARAGAAPGEVGPEPQAPLPDALVGNRDPALGQDQLNVPQTEAEDMIKPYGVADDLGRKAVARIAGEVGLHTSSLAQPLRSGQRLPTWQSRIRDKWRGLTPSRQPAPAQSFRPLAGNLPMPTSTHSATEPLFHAYPQP
jgi:hypothetical protein